jgi:D-hydroxyproline dehydrogenase subunit beta
MLAAEEAEVPRAREYAQAVGGVEHDTRADPWLADDLAAGYLVEGGYMLDPLGATSAMANAARAAGAELRLGCEAKQVLVAAGRVTGLDTDAGPIATERVIVATGPRARFLLRSVGIDVPIAASRGWLIETGPVAETPPYAIEQAAWPLQSEMGPLTTDRTLGEIAAGDADSPGLVSLLLGPRPAGQLVIGTSLRVSVSEEPESPETVRLLAERAVRIAPHLHGVTVAAAWSGRRAMTRDGLPVLGPVPGIEGLEVAAGFSSIGMVTIPAACRRFVRGEGDPSFDPARFL